jgi:uncharacterized membrane protein
MYKELHSRTFVKAVVWKIIASALTAGIAYYFTGEFQESANVGITTFFLGLITYYIYERIWNKIHWGKKETE